MLKMSEADIAVVAKQASDVSAVVTMIDVKRTFTSRLVNFAYGAQAILRGEHCVELPGQQSVILLAQVVLVARWVGAASNRLLIGYMAKIAQTPVAVAFVAAVTAIDLITMQSCFRLGELRQRFRGFATRALLGARRQIERAAAGFHDKVPFKFIGNFKSNLMRTQGAR